MKLVSAVAIFFVFTFSTILGSYYYAYSGYKSVLLVYIADFTDGIVAHLEGDLSENIAKNEFVKIQSALDKIIAINPFVDTLHLSLNKKTICCSSDRGAVGKEIPLDTRVVDGSIAKILQEGKSNFAYNIRYFEHGNIQNAQLFLKIDEAYLFSQINARAVNITLRIAVIQAAIMFLFTLLFYIFIMKPLRLTLDGARQKSMPKDKFFVEDIDILHETLRDSFELLTEEKNRLSTLIKTIPDLIWLKSSDGVYMFCNPSFERFFGAKEERIVGRTDYDFVDAATAEFFRQKDKEAMDKDAPSVNEEWISFADDGHKALLETIKVPLKRYDGTVIGVLGVSRDITHIWEMNEKSRQNEEKFRNLFENMSSGAIVYEAVDDGADFVFKEVNSAVEKIEHLTKEDLLGQRLKGIFSGVEEFGLLSVLQSVLKNGIPQHFPMGFYTDGRTSGWRENFVYRLSNGDVAVIYDDLSDKKIAEENLLELNKTLEERVNLETQKRVDAEQLVLQQSKMAMMGEMIGAIAHQWRQPLNALGLGIQDIREAYRFGELDEAYINETISSSMRQIQFMSKTIDDFRNFFAPNKEKTQFSVEKSVHQVLGIVSAQLTQHDIEVVFEPKSETEFFSYEGEFQQVMLNVITNAKDAILQTNPIEKKIRIEITSDEKNLYIAVEDTGGGVDPKVIDRIFEPYFTTKEQGKGIGIGLYMSKQILQRHLQGDISVKNIDGGARFTVTLPLS